MAVMNTRSRSGWFLGLALTLLMAGGSAYAQHAGGAHGGFGGFHGGGYRGGGAAGGYRGGVSTWRGGYGWRGGYYGWRGGYYGGWPYFYGALGYGLFFGALPYAYSTYWWDGVPYYYANSNYYQWDAAANAYETVAPPPSVATELFAYPRANQSAQQQARDRSECDQWATQQAQNHADHLRAQSACLEGRGYSVR